MPDHHLPHIYLDNAWYIVTAATSNHSSFLASERAKTLVRDKLRSLIIEFSITLRAWVILDNHYHLLLKTCRGEDLSTFVRRLHGSTSRQINLWDGVTGRQIWHNYWDTCVRDEAGL